MARDGWVNDSGVLTKASRKVLSECRALHASCSRLEASSVCPGKGGCLSNKASGHDGASVVTSNDM